MSWIIKDGFITNVDGDGIRIDDPSSGGIISGMTISNVSGSGIVIGGPPKTEAPTQLPLSELLDLIEAHIHELPDEKQEKAHQLVQDIRDKPNTFITRRGLKLLHEIAVDVTGTVIAKLLSAFVGAG